MLVEVYRVYGISDIGTRTINPSFAQADGINDGGLLAVVAVDGIAAFTKERVLHVSGIDFTARELLAAARDKLHGCRFATVVRRYQD